tara:strand:+ start:211 stop:522 length:312 start_codon:yes stop_codon:yes gene_type:complete
MIIKAILKINPNAKVSVTGSDIDTCNIEWHDETTPISKSDIEAKMAEVQTTYDNNEYQRDRAAAYPSLTEFVEAYTEKEIGADTTKWDEYIVKYNKVRSDNPK